LRYNKPSKRGADRRHKQGILIMTAFIVIFAIAFAVTAFGDFAAMDSFQD
jgi:hypothetical protein